MSKVDMEKLRSFTEGQSYPVNKESLHASAAVQGMDEEVVNLIKEIPEAEYNSPDEIVREIRKVEAEFQTGVWRSRQS